MHDEKNIKSWLHTSVLKFWKPQYLIKNLASERSSSFQSWDTTSMKRQETASKGFEVTSASSGEIGNVSSTIQLISYAQALICSRVSLVQVEAELTKVKKRSLKEGIYEIQLILTWNINIFLKKSIKIQWKIIFKVPSDINLCKRISWKIYFLKNILSYSY